MEVIVVELQGFFRETTSAFEYSPMHLIHITDVVVGHKPNEDDWVEVIVVELRGLFRETDRCFRVFTHADYTQYRCCRR